jgi:hypothetical protein
VLSTSLVVRASCGASPIETRRASDPKQPGAPAARKDARPKPSRKERDA